MRRKWRFVVSFVLILILANLLFWGYLFNGFAWSSKHMRFEQILCALPYPPDTVNPCTNEHERSKLYGAPENCFLEDFYKANMEHEKIVTFYETQLTALGWSVSNEKESEGQSPLNAYDYYTSTEILFTSVQRHWITYQPYWLWIHIYTKTNFEDSQIAPSVTVSISNDPNCFAHRFISDD
jgi:hypothetical protein